MQIHRSFQRDIPDDENIQLVYLINSTMLIVHASISVHLHRYTTGNEHGYG